VAAAGGDLTDDEYRRGALQQVEDQILHQTRNQTEVFLLLDVNGEPLFAKQGRRRKTESGGTQHEVVFIPEELVPFVGRAHLFTHNHPTDSSFTLEDVAVMAFLNVWEGNAFRPDVRYRLIRLVDRWPPLQTLRDEYRMLDREVEMVLGSLVRARRLSPQQAAAAHLHAVWTRFADRHASEYAYVTERRSWHE
jgi:hypothetical protein